MPTLFIVLLSLPAISAAYATPQADAVCDIRVDSDYGDRPPTIIRDGFTVDLSRGLIRVEPFTMSPWNQSQPSYYRINRSRREGKGYTAVQAIGNRNRRPVLLEISFHMLPERPVMVKIGDFFGDDTGWLEFREYFHMNLERCEGLRRLER